MFFGRLKKSFGLFRNPYRSDLNSFDLDFDICVFLTNEILKTNPLLKDDSKLYCQYLYKKKSA